MWGMVSVQMSLSSQKICSTLGGLRKLAELHEHRLSTCLCLEISELDRIFVLPQFMTSVNWLDSCFLCNWLWCSFFYWRFQYPVYTIIRHRWLNYIVSFCPENVTLNSDTVRKKYQSILFNIWKWLRSIVPQMFMFYLSTCWRVTYFWLGCFE